MKKKLTYAILIVILMITASIAVVFAWFVDTKNTNSITIRSGKVVYQFQGSMASGLVVPGQNLVATTYQITNQSTVNSQLRVKVTIKLDNVEVQYDAADDRVTVNLGLGTSFTKKADGYYYYNGTDNDEILLSTYTTPITIVDSIVLNGNEVRSDYSNKQVQIIITIQAKQADFVDWQTLIDENINFQTGN